MPRSAITKTTPMKPVSRTATPTTKRAASSPAKSRPQRATSTGRSRAGTPGAAAGPRQTGAAAKPRGSTRTTRPAARHAVAAPPPIDAAVEALVAWAIEEGLRTGDLDDLVLDAHLDLARRDHVPEHIKISGQRDAVCEAEEEKAYDAALAVNLSGFTRQFRFLVERIAGGQTAAPARSATDPVEAVRGWVERYRAG